MNVEAEDVIRHLSEQVAQQAVTIAVLKAQLAGLERNATTEQAVTE